MQCPYCGAVMQEGAISSRQNLIWYPDRIYHPFPLKAFSQKQTIILGRYGVFRTAVVAHVCRSCKKMVVDYGDPKSDLFYPK